MAVDSEQDKALIKQLVPLNALSAEQLELIANRITIDNAKGNVFLFREGDNDRRHIFLLQGQVRLLSGNREVDVVKSGGSNARFALAHQLPRKFSGQAVGEVRFAHIDSDLLHDLVVRNTHAQSSKDDDPGLDSMSMVLQARVLQQVPPANISNVLRRMEEITVKQGEVIINQGDSADYFYVLARGTGIVTRKDPGGDRQLAVLAQGDAFGEDALISGGVRAASVSMASNGTLMRLKKEDFSDLIRRPLVQGIKMDKARPLVKQGAIWLDIRHPEEYVADHLPGALNLPLENLRERYPTFEQEKKYIVYGPANLSAVGTFLLRERGFDVLMLEGWVSDQELNPGGGFSKIPGTSDLVLDSAPNKPGSPKSTVDLEQQLALYKTKLSQQVSGIRQLQKKLQDTAEEHTSKLTQKDAEIHQLQKKLQTATEENKQLEDAIKQTRDNKAVVGDTAPLKQRIDELEREVKRLRAELVDLEGIVEEASTKESTLTWEQVRTQVKLDQMERDLAEQYELNRILREESEEMARRMSSMQQK